MCILVVHVVAAALPPLPTEGDTASKHYTSFGKHLSPQDEDITLIRKDCSC